MNVNSVKIAGFSVKDIVAEAANRSNGRRRIRAGMPAFFKKLSNRRVRQLPVGGLESLAQQAALAAWDVAQEWERAEDADWVAKVRASYQLDPITGEGQIHNALEMVRDYAQGTFAFGAVHQEFPIIGEKLALDAFRCSEFGIGENSDGTGWRWLFHGICAMNLAPHAYERAMQTLRACQDSRYNSYWNE